MTKRDWRTPLWLFAIALVVRALPYASVYADRAVFLRDGDAYYHLRRIFYTVSNFPQALTFDSYVQFPHGSKIIWPAFLDTFFAAILWPFAQFGGLDLVERVAPWLPPILGALTIVATWALTKRAFGARAALWAGGLLCVLGGHFVYSRIGALDHHVAVSLMSALLLAAVLRAQSTAAEGSMRRAALATGALSGIALLVWPGAVLYVGLAFAGLAGAAALERDRERAATHWASVACSAALAALLVAPFSLGAEWPQWNSMTPVVLSNFQPWLLASVALVALTVSIATRRMSLGAQAGGRAGIAVAAGSILLGASLLVSQDLAAGFADAWRWLAKGEEFQSSVIESEALFVVRGKFSGYMARLQLTPLVYAFPLLWLYGCYEASRAKRRGTWAFLLVWSAVLFAVTLLQKRFLDAFTVAFAVHTAATLDAFWRRFGAAPGSVAARMAALAAVLVLLPLYPNYTPHLDNLVRSVQGEQLRLSTFHRANRILVGVASWIRGITPRTAGWLSSRVQPEYGVMAPWSAGHLIQQVGRRPTVIDNFGDDAGAENFALERRFWAAAFDESNQILEKLRVRYVVVTDGDPRAAYFNYYSTHRSLFLRDGSGVVASKGQASANPSTRHRLLMESQQLVERAKRPYAKVFEFVKGAVLRGRTKPGTKVGLSLAIETNQERHFRYRDRVESDPAGWFEFRVPYANAGGAGAVDVAQTYSLHCGVTWSTASVTEVQVQTGAVVPVGDPCQGRPIEKPRSRRPKRR